MSVEAMIGEPQSGAVRARADVSPRARSTAMWLMPIAAAIEALITMDVMRSIGFIPPLVGFLIVLIAIAVLGFARPGPRVFLVGGIALAVFITLNLPFVIDGLLHPIATAHAWTDIIALVVGIAGALAGFAVVVELRRDRPASRATRAPLGQAVAILVAGVLVGASYVSISGFSTLEHTPGLGVANGVVAAPAQPPVELDAVGSTFTQKTLQLSTGPGTIYVVNVDAVPHTFDVSIGGRLISYPIPARSTTAAVLDLPAAGTYTYWCAVPGHRATMEGSLEVIE